MAHAKEKEKVEREKIVGRGMTVGKKEGKEGWGRSTVGEQKDGREKKDGWRERTVRGRKTVGREKTAQESE